MENKSKTLRLYKDNMRIFIFAAIRFWTGSFIEFEKLIPKLGKILDLGCGYGILANYLAITSPKREIYGIDTDAKKIKEAFKEVENTKFSIGDATKIMEKKLETIILHDVLHHLNSYSDQEKLIISCKNMLTKNGKLFIVEVNNSPFWKLVLARVTDFFMYSGARVYYRYKDEIMELLKNYFPKNNIAYCNLSGGPFPQVLYICQKN